MIGKGMLQDKKVNSALLEREGCVIGNIMLRDRKGISA